MSKHKNFDCTIWEDGTIILTERLDLKQLKIKKYESNEFEVVNIGKIFKGSIESLSKNYKQLFKEG